MAKEGTTYSLFVGATSGIGNLTIQFDLINDDCETPTVIDAESVTFYGSSQLDLAEIGGGAGGKLGLLMGGHRVFALARVLRSSFAQPPPSSM